MLNNLMELNAAKQPASERERERDSESESKRKIEKALPGINADDGNNNNNNNDRVNEKCMIWADKPTSTQMSKPEQPERDSDEANER